MKKIMNWLRSGWHRIGASLTLTVLIVVLSTCVYAASIAKEVMEYSQTNVMLVNPDTGGGGSGWWVDNDTFVTACHVVGIQLLSFEREEYEGSETGRMEKTVVEEVVPEAQVSNTDGSVVLNLKVVSCNFETDVAVLKRQWLRSDSEFTPIANGGRQAEIGEELFCSGYGLGFQLHTTLGHYWGEQNQYEDPYDLGTCPTIFGDSGSPAVVLRDGVVYWVGMRQAIPAAKDTFVEHLVLLGPLENIEKELQR